MASSAGLLRLRGSVTGPCAREFSGCAAFALLSCSPPSLQMLDCFPQKYHYVFLLNILSLGWFGVFLIAESLNALLCPESACREFRVELHFG